MSQGQDQVQATMAICRAASDNVAALTSLDTAWRTDAARRLEEVVALLGRTSDKFFLQTKLCVPFTARCEAEARHLSAILQTIAGDSREEARAEFVAALGALEKAAQALEGRSNMRGMAIT